MNTPPGTAAAPSDDAAPYPTREALQDDHTLLLQKYTSRKPETIDSIVGEVLRFVRRAARTGVVLDQHRDRWAAQSLLDYWATVLYRHGKEVEATLADYDQRYKTRELTDADYPYPRPGHSDAGFERPVVLEECLNRLNAPPHLLVVIGSAGSGRSAAVRALVAALNRPSPLPAGDRWECLPPVSPGDKPLAALAGLAAAPRGKRPARKGSQLLGGVRALGRKAVVVVERLEELFTRCQNQAEQKAFAAELRDLVQAPDHPARVILVLQRGYEDRLKKLPGFAPLLDRGAYQLPAVSAAELRAAILLPAGRVGLRFEPGLVERIVGDLVGHPTPLLLLRFILAQLWERREKSLITDRAYTEIGRHQAVGTAAEAVYKSLGQPEELTQRLFLRLVRPGVAPGELIAGGVARKDLAAPGEAGDAGRKVIEAFTAAGLIRVRPGAEAGDDVLEPVYLPLISQWRRLAEWIRQDRRQAGVRALLAKAAQEWQQLGRSTRALWRGELLAQAIAFSDRVKLEDEFVVASQAAQAAAERWWRWTLFGVIFLLLIIAVLFAWGWRWEQKARKQQELLRRQQEQLTDISLAQDLSAQADGLGSGQLDLRLLLSLEAFEPHHIRGDDRREVFRNSPSADIEGGLFMAIEADPRLRRFLHGHTGPVYAVAYNRDGSLLASAGAEGNAELRGQVLLWDPDGVPDPAEKHKPLARLKAGADVRCLAFSSTILAAGTDAGTVALWDVRSRERLGTITLPPNVKDRDRVIRCLAFDASGTRLAAGGWDGCVRLWRVDDPRNPAQVGPARRSPPGDRPERGSVNAVAFSPKGDTLAAAGTGRAGERTVPIQLWAVTEGGLAEQPQDAGDHYDYVTALAYSPDGRQLISSDGDGGLLRTGVESHKTNVRKRLPSAAPITGLALDPDSKALAVADVTGRARLLAAESLEPSEANSGSSEAPLSGHRGVIWSVAFRPGTKGRQLATAGADGNVILWDRSPRELIQTEVSAAPVSEVAAVSLSGDGGEIAAARKSGEVAFWDTATGKKVELQKAGSDPVWDLAFAPNRKLLAGVNGRGEVVEWDWTAPNRTPKRRRGPLPAKEGNFGSVGVAYDPHGAHLVAWSKNPPAIFLWPVGTDEEPLRIPTPKDYRVLAVGLARPDRAAGPGGRLILIALLRSLLAPPQILRWDVTDSTKAVPLPFPKPLSVPKAETLVVSPDGRRLAVGFAGGEILSGELTEGDWKPVALTRSLGGKAHNDRVEKLAFTVDAKRLVSAGSDHQVGLWDAETGKGAGYAGHAGTVHGVSVATDPSGELLLASGGDDSTVRLWRFGKEKGALRTPEGEQLPQGQIQAMAIQLAAGRRTLAAALDTGDLVFWDLAQGKQASRLPAEHSAYTCLAFAPTRWLAAGGKKGSVSLWDAADTRAVTKRADLTPALEGKVTGVAFSPDGAIVAATSEKGQVRFWDVATLEPRGSLTPAPGGQPPSLAQKSALWDTARGARRSSRPASGGGLAFHPDGVLAGGADNLIQLWDAHDLSRPAALPQFPLEREGAAQALAFSPDGRLMASAEADRPLIYLWRVKVDPAPGGMGQPVRFTLLGQVKCESAGQISGLAFDPESKTLAWAAADGKVGFLEVSLDAWKRRAKTTANRDLTSDEMRRYHLPPVPAGPE